MSHSDPSTSVGLRTGRRHGEKELGAMLDVGASTLQLYMILQFVKDLGSFVHVAKGQLMSKRMDAVSSTVGLERE